MGVQRVAATPSVMKWARESMHLAPEAVAKKLKVELVDVLGWESGELAPPVTKLREMATLYKRPVAVFFLSSPPPDFQTIRDYRHVGGLEGFEVTPKLAYEIRCAYERREIYLELLEELGEKPLAFDLSCRLEERPDEVAQRFRAWVGVTLEQQYAWTNEDVAFKSWRQVLEQKGLLVFQAEKIDVALMRGFSICELPLPVIAVNNNDHAHGKSFSLFHELTHIALRASGLCNHDEDQSLPPELRRMEAFCNRVAAAVLMPLAALQSETVVSGHSGQRWSDETLTYLSRRYRVSRQAVLLRLLSLNLTTSDFYQTFEQSLRSVKTKPKKKESGGGPHPVTMTISLAGRPYTSIVLDSYRENRISLNRASDLLGLRVKHFERLTKDLRSREARA